MRKKTLPSAGLVVVAIFLAAFPGYSFGEVQINLRNESSIIADECREETDRLICYKSGGTFEIEKKDVLSVNNIAIRQSLIPGASGVDAAAAGEPGSSVKAGNRTDDALPAGKVPDALIPAKPSDHLEHKRQSLQAEREGLLRERQQIHDDIKNAPEWMSEKQFRELDRRNAELDARIKRFNEEAKGKKPGPEGEK